MFRRLLCAAVAALLVPTLAASAWAISGSEAPAPSMLAVPMLDLQSSAVTFDSPSNDAALASGFAVAPPDEPAQYSRVYVTGRRYDSSRYRPRREGSYRHSRWRGRGVSQLHAGFLDPRGPSEAGFLAGFRGGTKIDDAVEIGLGLDWRNKSGRATEVLQQTTGPGGETIIVRRDVSSYSSNLFPALAYVQVSGPSHLLLVPYVGAAASWQVLFLKAADFATGRQFDATFDGFGWQVWAGAAMPLSGRSRLVGEVFMNQAELNRDVYDVTLGQDIRETVNVDGVGARFGMSWGF